MRIVRLLLIVGLAGLGFQVFAGEYPDRPIKLLVPYPAGGGTDIAARYVAQKVAERLHGSMIVENRSGANGNLGTALMAQASPDGYTIGMATPGPVTVAAACTRRSLTIRKRISYPSFSSTKVRSFS